MPKPPIIKGTAAPRNNDLVYFLAALGVFVILALLASGGATVMR